MKMGHSCVLVLELRWKGLVLNDCLLLLSSEDSLAGNANFYSLSGHNVVNDSLAS